MSILDRGFIQKNHTKSVALMPYLTIGYPDPSLSLTLLQTIAENGADIIEVGIPHSDQVAGGTVIQAVSYSVLQQGIEPGHVFDDLKTFAETQPNTAAVIMSYYNIPLQYERDDFINRCQERNVSGLVRLTVERM